MASIYVKARTLPEAWEQAVEDCYRDGDDIPTQYDKEGDPPSKDCSAMIVITDPMAEPRIHKAFPGGLKDLYKYRQEVVAGVHDHWIGSSETAWTYTYHQRFTRYPTGAEGAFQDQLDRALAQLAEVPHTRRAQAITCIPMIDQFDEHSPCVQRVWFRVVDGKLRMHLHIRSNDALKAGFMNMYAFTELQRQMATRLSIRLDLPEYMPVGEYVHVADSWHIYGSYIKSGEMEAFLKMQETHSFEKRTWSTSDQIVQDCFKEALEELCKERQDEA